eukprot:3598739-Amphidinium_carterae.2
MISMMQLHNLGRSFLGVCCQVFAEAVKQSEYLPAQFVPAAIIGISMYFLKARIRQIPNVIERALAHT